MAAVPRLFLVTPKIADPKAFEPLLSAALAAADVACVLIRSGTPDDHRLIAAARALAPLVQRHGAAALIAAEARVAARLDLDGVQVTSDGPLLGEALAAMKPDRIVGVGGLASRDAAMAAGEAGVDYLMFGGPADDDGPAERHETVRERVAWWAEIFNVPCVGYTPEPDLAIDMAQAGAEFVGLGDRLWDEPDAIAHTLASLSRALVAEAA